MPTDLRAALREAAAALASEAANKRATINVAVFGDALPSRYDAIAARLRALADASPTVAELLAMVDAGHEVRWQSASAPDVTLRARLDTVRGIVFEARLDDRAAWVAICALPSDLTQPARLVEVTP